MCFPLLQIAPSSLYLRPGLLVSYTLSFDWFHLAHEPFPERSCQAREPSPSSPSILYLVCISHVNVHASFPCIYFPGGQNPCIFYIF